MASGDALHLPSFAEGKEFPVFLQCRLRVSKLRNPGTALAPWDPYKSLTRPWPQFPPIWNKSLSSSLGEQSREREKGVRGKGPSGRGPHWLVPLPCPDSPPSPLAAFTPTHPLGSCPVPPLLQAGGLLPTAALTEEALRIASPVPFSPKAGTKDASHWALTRSLCVLL